MLSVVINFAAVSCACYRLLLFILVRLNQLVTLVNTTQTYFIQETT